MFLDEEATRQITQARKAGGKVVALDGLCRSCLRAGLLEAARQLEAYAAHIRTLWPNGEHEQIVKTWDIAAADLRALAGEEPSHE